MNVLVFLATTNLKVFNLSQNFPTQLTCIVFSSLANDCPRTLFSPSLANFIFAWSNQRLYKLCNSQSLSILIPFYDTFINFELLFDSLIAAFFSILVLSSLLKPLRNVSSPVLLKDFTRIILNNIKS